MRIILGVKDPLNRREFALEIVPNALSLLFLCAPKIDRFVSRRAPREWQIIFTHFFLCPLLYLQI